MRKSKRIDYRSVELCAQGCRRKFSSLPHQLHQSRGYVVDKEGLVYTDMRARTPWKVIAPGNLRRISNGQVAHQGTIAAQWAFETTTRPSSLDIFISACAYSHSKQGKPRSNSIAVISELTLELTSWAFGSVRRVAS